jgi:Tfp pilus assembly protein PilO
MTEEKKEQTEVLEEETKIKTQDFEKVSQFSVFIYKYFKLIIFFEVVLILAIGYFFIIRKELSEIKDYEGLVLQKQEELRKIKEYKSDSLDFEKQYNILKKDIENDINKLYDILPPKQNLPNIMAQIEALVNNHGFMLGSISMSPGKEKAISENNLPLLNSGEEEKIDLIREVDIKIFVFSEEGGYDRVKELLNAFEHHIRFTDVISFSFEEDMESYSMILKTYYLNYEE